MPTRANVLRFRFDPARASTTAAAAATDARAECLRQHAIRYALNEIAWCAAAAADHVADLDLTRVATLQRLSTLLTTVRRARPLKHAAAPSVRRVSAAHQRTETA